MTLSQLRFAVWEAALPKDVGGGWTKGLTPEPLLWQGDVSSSCANWEGREPLS